MAGDDDGSRQATRRSIERGLFFLVGVLAAGVLFVIVLTLVAFGSPVVVDFDRAAVEALNAAVRGNQWLVAVLHLVTDLGGAQASWVILPVTVVWLLVRRSPRLATYVAVTGLGALILSWGVNGVLDLDGGCLVSDRSRPGLCLELKRTDAGEHQVWP